MLDNLFYSDTVLRIEFECSAQEIKALGIDIWDDLFFIDGFNFGKKTECFLAAVCFQGIDLFSSWYTCPHEDSLDLISG